MRSYNYTRSEIFNKIIQKQILEITILYRAINNKNPPLRILEARNSQRVFIIPNFWRQHFSDILLFEKIAPNWGSPGIDF